MQQSHYNSIPLTQQLSGGAQLAIVEYVEMGRPLTVTIGTLSHTIELVDAQLPFINVGDLVMVQNCQGALVVTHKLQRIGDEHAPQWAFIDNIWQLSCVQPLKFKCGDAFIELQPDGRIAIEGQEVLSYAERVNRIQGPRIEVN